MPVSKPSSVPSTRSGLSDALPTVPVVSTVCPLGPATGLSVRSAVLTPGCWPDPPYAARNRRLSTNDGKCSFTLGSSLATHDTLAFGYDAHPAWLPNALLLSTRTAPVRNSRSFHDPSCCAKNPSVLFALKLELGVPFVPVAEIVDRRGAGQCVPE